MSSNRSKIFSPWHFPWGPDALAPWLVFNIFFPLTVFSCLSMNDFARRSSCTCIAAYIVLACQQYENVYEHQANDCRRSAWQRQTGPSWRSSWRVQLNVPMFQPSVVVYGGHTTARTSTSLAEFGHRLRRDNFDDILCGAALVASPFVAFSGNR